MGKISTSASSGSSSSGKRKGPKNPHRLHTKSWWNWKLENANTEKQMIKIHAQWTRFKATKGLSPETINMYKTVKAELNKML